MSGINRVILVGRLGKDPKTSYLSDGTAVTSFSIATSESWKDKNTGEKKEKTEWTNCQAWRRLAEICDQYLTKGSLVYVEGKLQNRSYDKDGTTRYVTEVVLSTMQMLGSKNEANKPQQPAPSPVAEPLPAIDTDSIPF